MKTSFTLHFIASLFLALAATCRATDMDQWACDCNGIHSQADMVNWLRRYFADTSGMCGAAWDFRAARGCGLSVPSGQWCAVAGWAILDNQQNIKCCKTPHEWCFDKLKNYCPNSRGGGNFIVRASQNNGRSYSC